MKRAFRAWIAVLSIAVLVNTAGAISIGTKEVPMRGSGSGNITEATPIPTGLSITAVGEGAATHLGKFTRTEEILLNPNTGTFTGTVNFVSADGEELNCTLAGAFVSPTEAAGTYTITDGTGRFENASGIVNFTVTQSDPVNFSFAFGGVIDLQ